MCVLCTWAAWDRWVLGLDDIMGMLIPMSNPGRLVSVLHRQVVARVRSSVRTGQDALGKRTQVPRPRLKEGESPCGGSSLSFPLLCYGHASQ